jgi:transposase
MKAKARKSCSNCRRLEARLVALEAVVARLQEQLAAARKNSATSSKPPSSDIVKPPKPPPPDGQAQRKIGGQPGHPKHERDPFPPEAVNAGFFDHRIGSCPRCGHGLKPALWSEPRVIQQVDIQETPLSIQEHRSHPGWCSCCEKLYEAPLPLGIKRGGLVGPRLTTMIAYLKGVCHASFSTVRTYVRDVLGVTISRSQLAVIIGKVTRALEQPYQGLFDRLPDQERLNIDETGHKQNRLAMWTWCFRAELYTLFKIDPTRSTDVLINALGTEFEGVLGCDYFSSYRSYLRRFDVSMQFCLAHLIRDVKFLTTLPDVRDRAYGERLREALKGLFAVIHRREQISDDMFQVKLKLARADVLRCGMTNVPATRHSRNMANRFKNHGNSYFQFITTPGVEPTNNLAEQAIRFVVIDRRITQGTRSDGGNRWCERIWTVIATCTQQGRSVFEYLEAVVAAWFDGTEPPLLLPEV